MVIEGVDLSAFDAPKQKQLVKFLADLTKTKQSELKIAKLSVGSVHAFVEMPAQTAYQLKTMALNSEARFKELGIISLRLTGNLNFVDISRGVFSKMAAAGVLKASGSRMSFVILSIPVILVLLWMLVFAPRSQTPNIPPTLRPASTLTFTTTPTDVLPAATLTRSATPTPVQTMDRCSLFNEENIELVMLKWYPGAPLTFYFKFPSGIPGLENMAVDDGKP